MFSLKSRRSVALRNTICRLAIVTAVCALSFASAGQAQTFSVLHTFTGGAGDGSHPTGLAIDQAGNLYGASMDYPDRGSGLIFKMADSPSGWTLVPIHIFGATLGDGLYPNGVVMGPDRKLYGTTHSGGTAWRGGLSFGTVFRISAPAPLCRTQPCTWTETVLHSFSGPTEDGNWPQNSDLAFDQGGNIYGTTPNGGDGSCFEWGCGTVYRLTPVHGGWNETLLYQFDQGTDNAPQGGVVFDAAGNLYGVDEGGSGNCGTVFELQPTNGAWSKTVLFSFDCGVNGGVPEATLLRDSSGNLYGATTHGGAGFGGTVFELSPSGGQWNFTTLYSFTGANGGPTQGLTLDAAGNLYGGTSGDGLYGYGNVFKLAPSNGSWIYTSLYDFTGGSDGSGSSSRILFDAQGNLYGSARSGGNQNCTFGCGVVFKITP